MSQNQPPSIPPYQGGSCVPTPAGDALSPSLDKGRAGEGLASDCEMGLSSDSESAPTFDSPYLPYNKNLTTLARENRNTPTAAENQIWQKVLRMRQFAAYKFLRQKPVGDYIVDFYCAELQLVIEIDGDSHAETAEYDAERTRFLGSLGLRVIRFSNDDVLRNIEGVYEELNRAITTINNEG
ncbi:MAG: endonuclease domain-containing protein [Desulfuromonadaceae bacterium]|nr:endonuclease domain-containing protein [Desulfuromonadaceae bacterium]